MHFRKAAAGLVAAAFFALPFALTPVAQAAELTGQLYIPEDSGVSVGGNGGMGIGMIEKSSKRKLSTVVTCLRNCFKIYGDKPFRHKKRYIESLSS